MTNEPIWLYDLSKEKLREILVNAELKPYTADQIFSWIYQKNNQSVWNWSNISSANQLKLSGLFNTELNTIHSQMSDQHGTIKFLIELSDRQKIEAVLIKEKHYYTFCLSSQVGCPLNCSFCATGAMGFSRNLSPGEILNQILLLKKELGDYQGKLNLVFMGMGEPLLNYENLKHALEIIINPAALNISPRHITISTAGIPDSLAQLEADFPAVKISFSLNAPNQAIRQSLMPVSKKYPLPMLMNYFRQKKHKYRITFEYVMLRGINDQPDHIREIAELLRGIHSKINIIPFNEMAEFPYKAPQKFEAEQFRDQLMKKNLTVIIRWSKGKDIRSACGQLGLS